ncbi:MAG: signal peptidase I [Candidatus Acidiferrum sp.]
MTQLNLGASSISAAATAQETKRPPSRAKRSTVALLLGLVVPGLGQIYARRPWRGVAIALTLAAATTLLVETRLFLRFLGLVCSFMILVLWRLWIGVDGARLASKENTAAASHVNWKTSIAAFAIIFLFVVYPMPDYLTNRLTGYFRAFRIPSASMCPTLCNGEHFVAEMDSYRKRNPDRGDLILFKSNQFGQLLVKRVIGVAGDTVARGPSNTILVNNVPAAFPIPCGENESFNKLAPEGPPFETVKVSKGSLFVIGDNLDDSYDSRFFGVILLDEVRGKPKFIYWSHNRSRIGCNLR